MIRGALALARDQQAQGAAQAVLDAAGTAADAVVAGFLSLAGANPGVLFAPAVALLAGGGAGTRVIDGRAIQPGKGISRPRGYKTEAEIPKGAFVGVPRSLGLIALLHAKRGGTGLSALARPGIARAEDAGASQRAALLKRVGARGATALSSEEVVSAMLAIGAPVAGGVLTLEDLESAMPEDVAAQATALDADAVALSVPWEAPLGRLPDADAILACDGRGLVVALGFVPTLPEQGIYVPDLEVLLGKHGHPVRRGVPRIVPGTPLEMRAPLAILMRGGFFAAVALPGKASANVDALGRLSEGWPAESVLAEIREEVGATAAMAVLRDARDARILMAS